ncbi:hypothetical protein PFISCL1PPCAC_13247, partial [Pristionchus fissidentatus]
APMALLTMLNLYRYAHVTNFGKFEVLSTQFGVIYFALWLGFHALFHYTVATIFFQTDGDSIDQVADVLYATLGKGRDYGFELCIATYWVYDTFDT